MLTLIIMYLSVHAVSYVRPPYRSELKLLDAPNNMIEEIWNVVFNYCAPDLEVRQMHRWCRGNREQMQILFSLSLFFEKKGWSQTLPYFSLCYFIYIFNSSFLPSRFFCFLSSFFFVICLCCLSETKKQQCSCHLPVYMMSALIKYTWCHTF